MLKIKNLKVHFPVKSGIFSTTSDVIKAVDDVSFNIEKGSCVGLVGESGSGKSTIGKAIIRLLDPTAGKITYHNTDLTTLSTHQYLPFRKKIQMIFQDPFNSLNPRMTIASIISEPLDIHFKSLSTSERLDRITSLMETVGLNKDHIHRYPHEFSGGQRQRIGIARALAVEPEFLICDEPVSALDVSVQAQIINLLADLQGELNLTYLFISHDLAVVEHLCDHVLVMQHGKMVETGTSESIYQNPEHPYTRKLLSAIPAF